MSIVATIDQLSYCWALVHIYTYTGCGLIGLLRGRFFTVRRYAAAYAIWPRSVCLSVRLSQSSTKMGKRSITQTKWHNRQDTVVFHTKISLKFQWDTPRRMPSTQCIGKKLRLSTNNSLHVQFLWTANRKSLCTLSKGDIWAYRWHWVIPITPNYPYFYLLCLLSYL